MNGRFDASRLAPTLGPAAGGTSGGRLPNGEVPGEDLPEPQQLEGKTYLGLSHNGGTPPNTWIPFGSPLIKPNKGTITKRHTLMGIHILVRDHLVRWGFIPTNHFQGGSSLSFTAMWVGVKKTGTPKCCFPSGLLEKGRLNNQHTQFGAVEAPPESSQSPHARPYNHTKAVSERLLPVQILKAAVRPCAKGFCGAKVWNSSIKAKGVQKRSEPLWMDKILHHLLNHG